MDFSILRRFVCPEIVIGSGSRLLVANYASALGLHKPLVVTDNVLSSLPWVNDVDSQLRQNGFATVQFTDVTPNPRESEVMAGAKVFLTYGCDSLVRCRRR